MIELADKTQAELDAWLPPMIAHYVDERVGAGEDRDSAQGNAAMQFGQLFPDGRPGEGQHVMTALHDGREVGALWMGRPLGSSAGTWFVFWVGIDEEHRGKGLGREVMEAAEAWARAREGTRIALNVFGPNHVARSLYDSLGYEVMATSMFKDL